MARLQATYRPPEALGSPSGYVVPRVIAYYGLIRASGPLRHLWLRGGVCCTQEIGLGWETRGSPIYSVLCSRAASLTPVAPRVRLTVASSAARPSPRDRLGVHIGRFEAVEFTPAYFASCYGPRSASPPSRTFTSELSPVGSPVQVEYDYVVNSQLPRPDLHRRLRSWAALVTPRARVTLCLCSRHPRPALRQSRPARVSSWPGTLSAEMSREIGSTCGDRK